MNNTTDAPPRGAAFQAAMPPFVGACFPGFPAHSTTVHHLPVKACQRFLRRSAKPGFGRGGGTSEAGSGEGFCTVGGGGGASQGWSPANRMATPSSAYSRRTRWPSFFSTQMEKPGYCDAPDLEVSSTCLSSTGE